MNSWTVHVKPNAAPVLVPERFSWGAAFFGWLWLLVHRAWLPAIGLLAISLLVGVLAPAGINLLLLVALVVLQGLHGHDLRRWSLDRRGFALVQIVAARDADSAWMRLLDGNPDLARAALA